jgi:CelD/BcsL family acetyltransferase involved in cellulose biosynthesis
VQGFYLVAHDSDYDRFGPGKAILALVVQTAIAERYAVVDFMRGEEEYKQSYATREQLNHHYLLTRPSLRQTLFTALEPLFASLRTFVLRLREHRA